MKPIRIQSNLFQFSIKKKKEREKPFPNFPDFSRIPLPRPRPRLEKCQCPYFRGFRGRILFTPRPGQFLVAATCVSLREERWERRRLLWRPRMNEDDGVRRVEGGGARHAAEEKEKERGRGREREVSRTIVSRLRARIPPCRRVSRKWRQPTTFLWINLRKSSPPTYPFLSKILILCARLRNPNTAYAPRKQHCLSRSACFESKRLASQFFLLADRYFPPSLDFFILTFHPEIEISCFNNWTNIEYSDGKIVLDY